MARDLLSSFRRIHGARGVKVNGVPTSVICVLLTLMVSGCYISVRDDGAAGGWARDTDDWQHRQQRNREAIEHLVIGRSQRSIVDELGAADLRESFVRDGLTYQVLLYRTHLVHEDGRLTRDETTPLVFVDGELVGWGESAVQYALP